MAALRCAAASHGGQAGLAVEGIASLGHSLTMRVLIPSALLALAVTACVPAPKEAPPPPAPTASVPAPAPPPSLAADWRDWPLAPGDWAYRSDAAGSVAQFGPAGAAPQVALRCDRATRQVRLERAGVATSGELTITTSYGAARWPATPTPSSVPQTIAARAAADGALDQIAYSRGRFAIQAPGLAPIALPAWPEIGRVIEDCRG